MATTFLKRQKEMKRLEKQREKAERRAQKRLASRAQGTNPAEGLDFVDNEAAGDNVASPLENAAEPDPAPLK